MRNTALAKTWNGPADNGIIRDWTLISAQILNQWNNITPSDLEATHHDRKRIAQLVEKKYGVYSAFVESYLKNMERTLPQFQ